MSSLRCRFPDNSTTSFGAGPLGIDLAALAAIQATACSLLERT